MRALTFSLRLLALLTLLAGCYAASLDWRLALTVALGCAVGLFLAVPRFGITAGAILLCPIVLLSLLVSTASWASGGPISALLAALGPALVILLLPYAAARLSRRGLAVAIAASAIGLTLTVFAAQTLATRSVQQHRNPLASADENATVAASTAAQWYTYNSPTLVVRGNFQGQLDIPACNGLYSYTYVASIPLRARREMERFTFQPLAVPLRTWFSGTDTSDPLVPCTTIVNERPDGAIELRGACVPTNRARRFVEQHGGDRTGFDIRLPIFDAPPPLIPGPNSQLTIRAPANCIASTYPEAVSSERAGNGEMMTLNVGFPRGPSSLSEVEHVVSPPYVVHVQLLEPGERSAAQVLPVRALSNRLGYRLLFIASAAAAALIAWPAWRLLLGGILGIRIVAASREWAHRTASAMRSRRRSPMRKLWLALGIAFVGVVLFLLFPLFQIAWFIALNDPVYSRPLLLVAGSLGVIELMAFALRRAIPDRVGPAAEATEASIGHGPRWQSRAMVAGGLILEVAVLAYALLHVRRPAPPPRPAVAAPEQERRGQLPAARVPATTCTHFDAMVTPFGRGAAREAQLDIRATRVAATIDFPVRGIRANDRSAARVSLAAPVAISPGLGFTLREGGRDAGSGVAIGCNENRTSRMDIGTRLAWIVASHLGVEPRRVTMNARFAEDLGADSLDTMELMMAFEEEFAVEIPDNEADRLLTVGDATRYLQENAAQPER